MKLHLNNLVQKHLILACKKKDNRYQIKIGDTFYKSSIILTPEKLEMWGVSGVSELIHSDFTKLANLDAEVVILGTGDTLIFPEVEITQPLIAKGIGLEVMTTDAACRTYNILRSDGRHVAAGLIL